MSVPRRSRHSFIFSHASKNNFFFHHHHRHTITIGPLDYDCYISFDTQPIAFQIEDVALIAPKSDDRNRVSAFYLYTSRSMSVKDAMKKAGFSNFEIGTENKQRVVRRWRDKLKN